MKFDKADEYRDGRGAPRDAEFNDLWAACPINGAFYLDKKVNKLNTVLSKVSRYGKVLGCKFKVRDVGDSLKVSKYSLNIEKELLKKRQEETPVLTHDDIREYNINEAREKELAASGWAQPTLPSSVESAGQEVPWLADDKRAKAMGELIEMDSELILERASMEEIKKMRAEGKLYHNPEAPEGESLGKDFWSKAEIMFDARRHKPIQSDHSSDDEGEK